jgi:transposase
MRRACLTDLSDAEWAYLEAHLPAPQPYGRPRTHSPREILNAIFYIVRSGCAWRLLPHGNEHWEFDDEGYMRRRDASINDYKIDESERKFRWER